MKKQLYLYETILIVMNKEYVSIIVRETGLRENQVENTLKLLENGATIPFISRYRKESTGGMDEVQVTEVSDALERLEALAKRKETVIGTIESQDKLTPELKERIEHCWDATELEDIYAPYKPHRKTRADAAREKGLEPLAEFVMKRKVADAGVAERFEIASAATSTEELGEPVYPGTRRILARNGIDCSGKRARQLTKADYQHYDLLVGMDSENLWNMRRMMTYDFAGG